MIGVRLHGPRDVRFDDLPRPDRPAEHQVIVAPIWCGLCGTDVKYYLGKHPVRPGLTRPEPFILGHEFSARVVEVGSAVDHVAVGDRVAVLPLLHCGNCVDCWEGRFHLCQRKQWTGLGASSGGLADAALVEAYQATPLGDLSDEEGALVEPAAVAMNAVLLARVRPGDTVLVVGAGPIGSLVVLASQVAGAAKTFVAETNSLRGEQVKALGATWLGSEGAPLRSVILEFTGGNGVDVAVDCAGSPASLGLCMDAVRAGGVIAVPSVHGVQPQVDLLGMTRRTLTMIGSLGYTRSTWLRTMSLIASGALSVGRVVTSRIVRSHVVDQGLELLAAPVQGETKVLVRIDG